MRTSIQKITQYLFRENRMLVLTLGFLVIFSFGTYAFAVFNPGDTNDPSCSPGDSGCYVASGNTLLTGVSGAQTVIGGTAAGEFLNFAATTATAGRDTGAPAFKFTSSSSGALADNSFVGTNLAQTFVSLATTINQSGTAGYTALSIAATETATGSGSNYLINALAGASGTTSKFSVSNTGVITASADALIHGVTVGIGTGTANTLFGNSAGALIISSNSYNSLFGDHAGSSLGTTAIQNSFFGSGAGAAMTSGTENTAFGANAMGNSNISPGETDANTAIGSSALLNSTGHFNTALGEHSGIGVTTGAYNTLLGPQISGVTSGSNNIIVSTYNGASFGGNGVITGSYNTYIGGALGGDTSNTVSISDGAGNLVLYSPASHNVIFGSTVDSGGLVQIQKNFSGTPSSSVGSYFNIVGSTFTDSATSASGTATGFTANSIGQAILSATNSSVTTTNAYGLYLAGAPKTNTNDTMTNTTSLYIATSTLPGATTNSFGLQVNAQSGASNNYAAVFNGGNVGVGNSAPTGLFSVGSSSQFQIDASGIITAAAGITSSGNISFTAIGTGNGSTAVCINTGASGLLSAASTSCTVPSALRFKHDISDLTGNLDKVLALRPVSYTSNTDNSHNIGFIAEDVALVENRLVDYDTNGQVMGLNYAQFAPLLAGAIKELNGKFDMKIAPLTSIDPNQNGSLASLVSQFLQNAVVAIKDLTVGTLRINDKVCVDDVCVTKDQFKQILQNANSGGGGMTPPATGGSSTGTGTEGDGTTTGTTGDTGTAGTGGDVGGTTMGDAGTTGGDTTGTDGTTTGGTTDTGTGGTTASDTPPSESTGN